jgi:hypothetical protein
MYVQGLKQTPLNDIIEACAKASNPVRQKDVDNYWNGYYRSGLHGDDQSLLRLVESPISPAKNYLEMSYLDYPVHPFNGMPEIERRWVPCNTENKPLIKWSQGCMSKIDAECMMHSEMLAENLKGTKMIVIDCDGDHGDTIDVEPIAFLGRYIPSTYALLKPVTIRQVYLSGSHDFDETDILFPYPTWSLSPSFHLTFATDRVIPTMHFPEARIDIIGNRANSLRYLKNKVSNGKPITAMTPEIWDDIKNFVRKRKERSITNELARVS